MIISRRQLLAGGGAAFAASLTSSLGWAGAYPQGPVRLVVGFPTGGPVDIAGRSIAAFLSRRLGQPFTVGNEPGESGNRATRQVLRSAPDGHTLLVCGPVNVINTMLFRDLDFDFGREITPIAGLYRVPLIVEAHPSLGIRTVSELVERARAAPGRLRVGYAGRGTPQHVGIELFRMMAGVDLTLVPYAGSAPALADLLAERVDLMFDPMPSSIEHIRGGRLVPLAVTTPERSRALPGVPSVAEVLPGYEAGSWFGLVAPSGIDAAIVEALNAAVNAGLDDAELRTRIEERGGIVLPGSAAAFAAFLAAETQRYARVVREAKLADR
ncbi:Bug family tripartite tricarboxylate transporter substrate binding protein [Methylobacterium isbiliense]|uniref:Tripartite tricarboxylate transporter family receptor n=1 Tax=Methylobacterium isbiliense TaxID=315478 RepID=A0ABQ4SEA0_9HYPH|nr:tripartite tricarboxylate transporter substrate-binding protein [Methylobacterium isbiliense]GJE00125.1 hypothetical protein GMJLKIPL_2043 [Methylobacterium isbiliense]